MSLEYADHEQARVIRGLKDTQLGLQKTIAFWKRCKILGLPDSERRGQVQAGLGFAIGGSWLE